MKAGKPTLSSGDEAVDLKGVRKVYKGKVEALRGVDLTIHGGEVYGLLGPNGAGKSTLVKIMMTVVRPTKGSGTILGFPMGHKASLRRIGYLPEHHRIPQYLTGQQVLDIYGGLHAIDRSLRRKRSDELLELVGMTEWRDKKVGSYSKGMQQRLGLAQALINDPDIVVLDEPTDGVDPVGRRDIRDILVRLKGEGKCIFLNSHLLSELEMVCDRVSILVQGGVAMEGTLDDLTADSRHYEVVIKGDQPSWISEVTSMKCTSADGTSTLRLESIEADNVQSVLDRLRQNNHVIIGVRPVRETLEDLFMRAVIDPETGHEFRPGARRSEVSK